MFQDFGFKRISACTFESVVCFLAGHAIQHMRGYIARVQRSSGTRYLRERVCSSETWLLFPVLPYELHLTFGKSLKAEPQITLLFKSKTNILKVLSQDSL